LFLGESESLSSFATCSKPWTKNTKSFPENRDGRPSALSPPPSSEKKEISPPTPPGAPEGFQAEVHAQREADRVTLNRYAPPGVLINAQSHVLQFRGDTSPFLKPPTGNASFHVLKMAREGLIFPLRAAIKQAKEENLAVRREGVRVAQNGAALPVNFEVVPLTHLKEPCCLIFFELAKPSTGGRASQRAVTDSAAEKRTEARGDARPPKAAGSALHSHVAELERELSDTRDYVQSIQEQYEAANEELQSANEEVNSANEELQSTNEELETSKEELESTNEELLTVNDEMASRNAELGCSNADLNNLHASVNLPILVLTRDLAIRRFTPPAEKLFNLAPGDVGRPLSDIKHNLDLPDLELLLHKVIDTVSERAREVQDKEGRWLFLRARPYLTLDNKIDGAVLVAVDIHALKEAELKIQQARDYAEAMIRTARDPLVVLRADLRVTRPMKRFTKPSRWPRRKRRAA